MAEAAVEIQGLSKTYRIRERRPGFLGGLRHVFAPATRAVPAITDVSFRIEPGERVAFVGPNGAGKSTTLRVLYTVLRPDAGSAVVDDIDVVASPLAARRAIG